MILRLFFTIISLAFAIGSFSVFSACGQLSPEEPKPGENLLFRTETRPFTRGAEFSGDALTSNARLLITASQMGEDGEVEVPSYFTSGGSPVAAEMEHESGNVWKIKDQVISLPPGKHYLNFIAFGADSDAGNDVSAFGTGETWAPVLDAGDAASVVRFTVNTYANQMDMMYGAVNRVGQTDTNPVLSLSHSQAQLVFNVKFTGDDMAFIENNGSDYKFKLDDILFLNDTGFSSYVNHSPVTADNITLQTYGTFTIDNRNNDLEAEWTALSSRTDAYSVPMGTPPSACSVNNTSAEASPVFSNTRASWEVSGIMRNRVYQLGHPLLVPEQITRNFIVVYSYEGTRYYSKLNVPQGLWKSGRQYFYTLVFTELTNGIGMSLRLIASVADWDDSAAPNAHPAGLETKFFLDAENYRRYDEDDNLATWTDSYVAVAYGTDAGGAFYSPLLSLISTSSGSGLRLVSDNPGIRFVRYTTGGGAEAPVASLSIPAGTNVATSYYVVPDSATIPVTDVDRKAGIYLLDVDGNIYIPYNTSALPGNDINTSCQFYIVSPSVYESGTAVDHIYDD